MCRVVLSYSSLLIQRPVELSNAIKIKRGKETIIFRTEKPEDKKALLMAFKKVAEELSNKRRKDMLSEAEARKGDVSQCFPLTSPLLIRSTSSLRRYEQQILVRYRYLDSVRRRFLDSGRTIRRGKI